MAEEDQQDPVPKTEQPTLNILVKDQSGNEVHFRVKKSTKLGKMMNAYCEKKSLAKNSVRFVYDGMVVSDGQTPEELDMEDQDTIDVFIEQVGGALQ